MMNIYVLEFLVFYIVLELYEVLWQKGERVIDMLGSIYKYYHKNIFLVLLMHPTFPFAMFLVMFTNYNGYAVTFFIIKGVDIITKLLLVKQVFIDQKITDDIAIMLEIPLGKFLPYMGLLIYPPFIYMALRAY